MDFMDIESFVDDDFNPTLGATDIGALWAINGHVSDRSTRKIVDAIEGQREGHAPAVEYERDAKETRPEGAMSWATYYGQDTLKEQMAVYISSAKSRGVALDHILLASGIPGVGKTTAAHLIADDMDAEFVKLVPPFKREALFEAAKSLPDGGVLFIDEIHKLADNGPAMAESLLHILEEGRIYEDQGYTNLSDITVIGATTDAGNLPSAVLDRFPIRPPFEPYDEDAMISIVSHFCGLYRTILDFDVVLGIAKASRKTPRVARQLVTAARDLEIHYGRSPSLEEILDFKRIEPDGMTVAHRDYLLALYRYFGREKKGEMVYVAGAASLRKVLRETEGGLESIERFLIERGYVDQSPSGRRLTAAGQRRAMEYEAQVR